MDSEAVSSQDNVVLSSQQGAKFDRVLVSELQLNGTSGVEQCTVWAAIHSGPAAVCANCADFFGGL